MLLLQILPIAGKLTLPQPCVAILHAMYAVYHLGRAAVSRPPGSTASYMFFAATIDAGLVPFYAFTTFISREQYTQDTYGWQTLFNQPQKTTDIVEALFVIAAVGGGVHLVSFAISLYLAMVFRQIARLPPDMNPLENNLTARPHKRSKSELTKHLSGSTLNSIGDDANDPYMTETRSIPFAHTRQGSSVTLASDQEKRSKRNSRADLPSQQRRLYEQSNQSSASLSRSSAQKAKDSPSRTAMTDVPVLKPTTNNYIPTDFRWGSPVSSQASDNWVTYPSRNGSPVDENIARQLSPIPSEAESPQNSVYSGVSTWLDAAQKLARRDDLANTDRSSRGAYSSINDCEYYENDNCHVPHELSDIHEDTEQDLGDRQSMLFSQEPRVASPIRHPLGMNPPTPQPPQQDEPEKVTPKKIDANLRRQPLTDRPNPSVHKASNEMSDVTSDENMDRYYSNIEGRIGLSVLRAISGSDEQLVQEEKARTPPQKQASRKLRRRKSGKIAAYEVLRVEDEDHENASEDSYDDVSDDDHDYYEPRLQQAKRRSKSKTRLGADEQEGDRKGRVVSNSGIDLGNSFKLGAGTNSSYSSYISGLGVGGGRRRDVSGKVAEEGRGGTPIQDEVVGAREQTPEKPRSRAAGWARFAGL